MLASTESQTTKVSIAVNFESQQNLRVKNLKMSTLSLQLNDTLPLFQLYSFITSICPLGLKGPFSENAPTPTEEQPGPFQYENKREPNILNFTIF